MSEGLAPRRVGRVSAAPAPARLGGGGSSQQQVSWRCEDVVSIYQLHPAPHPLQLPAAGRGLRVGECLGGSSLRQPCPHTWPLAGGTAGRLPALSAAHSRKRCPAVRQAGSAQRPLTRASCKRPRTAEPTGPGAAAEAGPPAGVPGTAASGGAQPDTPPRTQPLPACLSNASCAAVRPGAQPSAAASQALQQAPQWTCTILWLDQQSPLPPPRHTSLGQRALADEDASAQPPCPAARAGGRLDNQALITQTCCPVACKMAGFPCSPWLCLKTTLCSP